jgi:tRNA pseudouridine38-40 synthase
VTTFKITIAYDGTDLVGWQRQAAGVSIQGLLEEALRDLDQRDVTVTGAGRTDAGVHALGQVASIAVQRSIDAPALLRALNARLPATVRVTAAEPAAATFHARFDATRKWYRYRIWNAAVPCPFERAYTWHVSSALDLVAMNAAAALVAGRRDFAAFQAAGSAVTSTEREVFESSIRSQHAREDEPDAGTRDASAPTVRAPLVVYDISGSGFLRHMVRNIVGSLVEIGRGRRPVEWMTEILDGRSRALAGPTAPPQGLVLVAVEYGLQSQAIKSALHNQG